MYKTRPVKVWKEVISRFSENRIPVSLTSNRIEDPRQVHKRCGGGKAWTLRDWPMGKAHILRGPPVMRLSTPPYYWLYLSHKFARDRVAGGSTVKSLVQ